jgi:hypothetical protein
VTPMESCSGEVEAFDEIISDWGDFYAFAGARGVATILKPFVNMLRLQLS